MEATVIELNRDIQDREASQWAFLHHHLEALLNSGEEFLRHVSAHNT